MIRYEGLGLDNIWLVNGYRTIDTGYGPALVVENLEKLEHAVASRLVNQSTPLNGQEFRFVRDMLEMSQDAFGKRFGRDYQTVARWEAARHKPVPRSADAMIRQLYLERQGARPLFTDIVEKLASAAGLTSTVVTVSFRERPDGTWHADDPLTLVRPVRREQDAAINS